MDSNVVINSRFAISCVTMFKRLAWVMRMIGKVDEQYELS